MPTPPDRRDRRAHRGRQIRLEALESRALLATTAETFTGPSLSALIRQAQDGQDTAPAAIDLIEGALQSQLTSGPLADLNSGAVTGDGFVAEAQSLESSYEQDLAQQLSPEFPHVNEILVLQGREAVDDFIALDQQADAGAITSATLATDAQTAIDALTGGSINPLDPSLGGYTEETESLEADLSTLAQDSGSTATTSITPSQAGATAIAETQAYQADLHAGLEVLHPIVSNDVDTAVSTLEGAEGSLAQDTSADAQSALTASIAAFDATMLGSGGLFARDGAVADAMGRGGFAPNESIAQSGSALSGVSGTATVGGTATLTATLTSTGTDEGIAGATLSFTLDGAFAGIATTSSDGVATLSGVPTSDAVGTDTGGVVATFDGDIADVPASASGDLTVNPPQAPTTLGSVPGTDSYGGTASLTATLTSTSTGQGVANEPIAFTLDGTSVGTATTNSIGVATLTGVTTSDAIGTDTGGVVASFSGDTSNAASTATGDLVVSPAATAIGSVSGTATGGTASLTATLTSTVTNAPLSGQSVTFTLDGTSVGSATTDSDGIATLTGVTTSDATGTDTGGIVVNYAGDTDYAASTATGNLVVS